jgi:hypothetical protein
MIKHTYLLWKDVECISTKGNPVLMPLPEIIDHSYRGTLLSKILLMQKKDPIPFAAAINLIAEKQKNVLNVGFAKAKPGHFSWYINNFVSYISSLGFHIEITGDEFVVTNQTLADC